MRDRDGSGGGTKEAKGRYKTGRWEEISEMSKKRAKNAEFIGGFGGQNTFFYKKKSCTLAYIKNYV